MSAVLVIVLWLLRTVAMRLRKRLICHYCGTKSKKSNLDGDRFECEKCESINIFDAKGELVDAVPDENGVHRSTRYAAPASFQENSIFCSACLKNQHLYTTALSQFLPDPDDPNYSRLEAAVTKFKESLEERYPQCCATCEPKVRAQLEHTTYQAKSDHMRRVLERSKEHRLAGRLEWKNVIVRVTGLLYFLSLLVQLFWHATGLTTRNATPHTLTECIPGRKVPVGCLKIIEPYVGWSILLAVACSWWNPQWQQKLHRKDGRLVGLWQYYQLQLVLLATRFAAWLWCADFPTSTNLKILHTLFLASIIALSSWAMLTVRFDTTPRVNWDYRPPRLVSGSQFVPPARPLHDEQTFDVMNLAPTTAPDLETWRPPTPPLETDEMDWQPSQQFDPPKQILVRTIASSPFYGVLPSLSGPRASHRQKPAIGIPPGHFDKKDQLPVKKNASVVMAEPKFFPPSDDTGLEAIFDQVFSLHEPTSTPDKKPVHTATEHVSRSKVDQPPETSQDSKPAPFNHQSLLLTSLMLIALMLWTLAAVLEAAIPSMRFYAIGMALSYCISRFTLSTVLTTRFILPVEILALIGLGCQLLNPNPVLHSICDKIGSGLFTILLSQEVVFYLLNRKVGD